MYQEQENSVSNYRFNLPHMELSLRGKQDANPTDNDGLVPLHYAAYGNRLEEMKLLLKNGANVNIVDNSSKTVLHLSVFKGYTEITRLLLGDIESPSTSCSDIRIEEFQVISQSYC